MIKKINFCAFLLHLFACSSYASTDKDFESLEKIRYLSEFNDLFTKGYIRIDEIDFGYLDSFTFIDTIKTDIGIEYKKVWRS